MATNCWQYMNEDSEYKKLGAKTSNVQDTSLVS